MGFGENVLWPKYIDIYQFRWRRGGGGVHGLPYIFLLLKKMKKVQEHDRYLY